MTQMLEISPVEASLLIHLHCSNGSIFFAEFVKKDGSLRSGRWRLATTMSKGKTGKGLAYDPAERGYIVAYDFDRAKTDDKPAYRMINVNTMTRLKVDGKEFRVVEGSRV